MKLSPAISILGPNGHPAETSPGVACPHTGYIQCPGAEGFISVAGPQGQDAKALRVHSWGPVGSPSSVWVTQA